MDGGDLEHPVQRTDYLYIRGTVFGGGEANASGSEVYDFSFISVTQGIQINIDGQNYRTFRILGSIFGSGNASSTTGDSYIDIKNYGTMDNLAKNISIQRATEVMLDNSCIVLEGTTDRTNEYSTVKFTFSRIDHLKIKNNSSIFLECGTNLLKEFSSLVGEDGQESLATATINEETGATTKNVTNRLYIYEGKNINIALNENITLCGDVNGMTFLGLYNSKSSPVSSTGFYHHSYNNADQITNAGTFVSNSYVKGAHKSNHDIHVDGFYTNYNEEGIIKSGYVGVTPDDDTYYIWSVGEEMDVTTFPMTLTASKYATLGTYELSLAGFSTPNTKFIMMGFSAELNQGIVLRDQNDIEPISQNETTANTVFGLSMRTGKSGWQTNNRTDFYTYNGETFTGNNNYHSDNSNVTPSLIFCLYHSQNLSIAQELGRVTIRLQVLKPIDDLNDEISYIDIVIDMNTLLNQDSFYEAAISPGEESSLFTTVETNITEDGMFSTYYSLIIDDFSDSDYYQDYATYKRVLVSRDINNVPHVFKANTKITMLDMTTDQYYYYNVTQADENNNVYQYELNKFIRMGSTDERYNESTECMRYYNTTQDLIYENFIFHVDLSQSNILADSLDNTLLIELQDSQGETLIGVLNIQRETTKYSIYKDKKATIAATATAQNLIYLGDTINLNVNTNLVQNTTNNVTVYDTKYFDSKLGLQISIFDNNGNQLNSDTLFGVNFEYEGVTYYPRIDGTIRIKIADRVTNVLSRIKIHTANNTTLATGDYVIKVETFGSPDGIYYGLETSGSTQKNIRIINGAYGLKVTTANNSKIVDKETGNIANESSNSITATVNYSSRLTNPNIVMILERRDYTSEMSLNYITVDLANYVSNNLTAGHQVYEYTAFATPNETNTITLQMKQNLRTGTYKLIFKLYDGEAYIGEAFEYIIIM